MNYQKESKIQKKLKTVVFLNSELGYLSSFCFFKYSNIQATWTSFGGDREVALTPSMLSSCGGGWSAQLIRSVESNDPTPHQLSLLCRLVQGSTCCFLALDAPRRVLNCRPTKRFNNWICDPLTPYKHLKPTHESKETIRKLILKIWIDKDKQ